MAQMTRQNSGLTPATIEQLAQWDRQFDAEVHDARLSRARFIGWGTGRELLPVGPRFQSDDHQFPNYMNRFLEVAWMTHRLLPLLQTHEVRFSSDWQQTWRDLDDVFREFVLALTRNLGKNIGAAVVELVDRKFPFDVQAFFPETETTTNGDR
ncbi:MAG TPA: hypothetical protein VGB13_12830 [Candidatus Krumholzibacteria bacterium]